MGAEVLVQLRGIFKVWFLCSATFAGAKKYVCGFLRYGSYAPKLVGFQRTGEAPTISIDEELGAAREAKRAIERVSPNIGAMVRKAKDIAIRAVTTLPTDRSLDDARYVVIAAVSRLLDGRLSQGKIAEAKASIEDWMKLLVAAAAIDYRP